jgi:ankyrin repeat protein
MVRILVEHGADVNARGTSGDIELSDWLLTPLWRAAHDGRIASVRLLIEHGADVNVLNPDGCNQALKTAIENGRAEVCAFLLAEGAHPDIHSAAMLGLIAYVQQWIDEVPSLIAHRDEHGRSPLDAAVLMDTFRVFWPQNEAHDQIAELLVNRGAPFGLEHAASAGWIDRVKNRLDSDSCLINHRRPCEPLLTGAAEYESAWEAARRRHRENILEILLPFKKEGTGAGQ